MFRSSITACLDIGSEKIVTLIASRNEETKSLNIIGAATAPASGIRKSQIIDIEETIKAITKSVEAAERMAGLSINQAFISIGGSHIGSQNSTGVVAVAQPEAEITGDDVARVIEAARAVTLPSGQEIIHVLPRTFKVDAQGEIKDPIGMSGVRLESEVHIVTGSATAVKNLTKCVSEIGINVAGMVFSGLASSESVLTPTEKELGVILVDIGAGTTSIAVWIEGALSHSAVLPIGAKNITNDLAIGMRVSLDVAEKVKRFLSEEKKSPILPGDNKNEKKLVDEINLTQLGIESESPTASKKTLVDGIIKPRLHEIFTMVGMEVKNSGFGGQTPAGVVLTGGGAKTVDAESVCKRTLSLPTRIGTPHSLAGLIDEIQEPAYSTAEGLILFSSHEAKTSGENKKRPKLGKILSRIPLKSTLGRTLDFFKQFLP